MIQVIFPKLNTIPYFLSYCCSEFAQRECGASEQTADHVLTACPIHRAPHGARGLTFWMTKLDAGLITPLLASDPGSAAVWGSKRINPRPQKSRVLQCQEEIK